jgi:tRNA threonylcarbamoyladenosine biosynthesis protein TsaE
MQKFLVDTHATERMGAQLWASAPAHGVIFLQGDLGAGKTTLVRGLLRAAGVNGTVKSPTYTLVEEYWIAERRVCHFDLYRLHDPAELEWMGFADYLDDSTLCIIEWPEQGGEYLPVPDMSLYLAYSGTGRLLRYEGNLLLDV